MHFLPCSMTFPNSIGLGVDLNMEIREVGGSHPKGRLFHQSHVTLILTDTRYTSINTVSQRPIVITCAANSSNGSKTVELSFIQTLTLINEWRNGTYVLYVLIPITPRCR